RIVRRCHSSTGSRSESHIGARIAGEKNAKGGRHANVTASCSVQCTGGRLVLPVDQLDANGALAARVARIGLLVEGDLLAFLHHLEATIGDGRVMEEEVVSATLGGDEAESTVAKALDRSGCHDCTAF